MTGIPSAAAVVVRRMSYGRRVAVVTLVGAALRLVALGSPPLWRDEAFTALAVHRPLGSLLHVIAHDSAPPLSYVLQHAIVTLWDGPGGLRVLSALAGTAAIPLAAALGRRIGGARVGLWCAVMVTVFPSLVLASRDARMYAMATTLVLAATLALWRLAERPSWRRVGVYGLCSVLAFYTNYFTVLAAMAQLLAVTVLVARHERRRVLLMAGAAVAFAGALLVPWLVYARAQFAHGTGPFWVAGVGFSTLSGVAGQFFGGASVDGGVPHAAIYQALQGLAIVIGMVGLVMLIVRYRSLPVHSRRSCQFLAACGLGGIAMLVMMSIWHPLVEARYASVMVGPLICLVGVGFSELTWRAAAQGGAACLAAIALIVSIGLTEPDTPTLAKVLDRRVRPGDLVVSSPAAYLLVLQYADARVGRQTHIVSTNVPWYWGTAIFPPGAVLTSYPPPDSRSERIYYIDVPGQPVATKPPSTYELVRQRQCYSTICVRVYAMSG